MKDRNGYFDFLRGIAIIMVVGIHTQPEINGFSSLADTAAVLVRLFLNCAVPLFLAISGWFLAPRQLQSKQDIVKFYKKRFPRVYIPLLIWGLGWFAVNLWNEPTEWGAIKNLIMLLTGGFSVYYFVSLIIQCYLITPLLSRHYKSGIFICAVMSAIAISATSWLINIEGHSFPLLLYAGPVYVWIIFYMMGIWLRKNEHKDYFSFGLILALLGFIMQIVEYSWYLNINGGGLGIKLSSFIFSAGIILILVSHKMERFYRNNRATRVVAWIGEISFGVYFLHVYCISFLGNLLGPQPWIVTWSYILALSIVIIWMVKKVFPKKFTHKFLGF